MRISDWSSDVCSSDLMLRQIDEAREGQRHAERALAKAQRRHEEQQTELTELRLRYREQLQKLEQQRTQIETLTTERQTLTRQVLSNRGQIDGMEQIGREHVGTPVTNAHLVCRL